MVEEVKRAEWKLGGFVLNDDTPIGGDGAGVFDVHFENGVLLRIVIPDAVSACVFRTRRRKYLMLVKIGDVLTLLDHDGGDGLHTWVVENHAGDDPRLKILAGKDLALNHKASAICEDDTLIFTIVPRL